MPDAPAGGEYPKHFSTMDPAQTNERRRHRRYEAAEIGCRLRWLDEWTENSHEGSIEPRNLSITGISLLSKRRIHIGEQLWLQVILPEPLGTAAVRCIVRWVREEPGGGSWSAGAEILESTKAWIGPEEDCRGGWVS